MTKIDGNKPCEIFRKTDYRDNGEHGIIEARETSSGMSEALAEFHKHGFEAGQQVSMAYSRRGVSLTHVWFKSGHPLPLHAHSENCLYFLLAGSIRTGSEELGLGDGFFAGGQNQHTYEMGPLRAEVLKFRARDNIDIRFMVRKKSVWDKTIAKLKERRTDWIAEAPPNLFAATGNESQTR